MASEDKAFLAGRLVELLSLSGATQTELAKYAGVKQGHVNDHVRRRSYPKLSMLLKYSEFFSSRLGRRVTLYDLTGIEELKDADIDRLAADPEIEQLIEWFRSRPDGDELKELVRGMILKGKQKE